MSNDNTEKYLSGTELKWADFNKLETCEELENYFENRAYSHSGFFHYTRLSIANSVIQNKRFWLSNVRGFNDKHDVAQFGDSAAVTFSMCFSTGVHENLPMWYMYSGINGKGARFAFTKAQIKALIETGTYMLCQKRTDGIKWKNELENGIILSKEDFETKFCDVLYYAIEKDRGKNAELKYTTLVNNEIPKQEVKRYLEKHQGFSKKIIWSYERETRLLVYLKGKTVEYMNKKYKHIDESKDPCQFVVTLDFGNVPLINKGMKITLGPDIKNLKEVMDNPVYAALKNFADKTSNISASDYAGEFEFDLCRDCPNLK